jgi:outer membrane lipoprotein-sorting protein
MPGFRLYGRKQMVVAAFLIGGLGAAQARAQQFDQAAVIQKVDAAVKARLDGIEGYNVTEHYAVYRNKDESHPVAEMMVNTTYRRDTGKEYTIVSQSGSEIIRSMVLGTILDHEKQINQPGTREGSWFTSANYEMQLKSGGIQQVDGRDCLALAISPKRKAPNLIQGTMWVDAADGSIVQVQGVASKSPSVFTGPAQMMRQYTKVNGFSQATHARAVSNSLLFGETVVKIDYTDYKIQLRPPA